MTRDGCEDACVAKKKSGTMAGPGGSFLQVLGIEAGGNRVSQIRCCWTWRDRSVAELIIFSAARADVIRQTTSKHNLHIGSLIYRNVACSSY